MAVVVVAANLQHVKKKENNGVVAGRIFRTMRVAGAVALISAISIVIAFFVPGFRHGVAGASQAAAATTTAQNDGGLEGLALASGTGTLDMRRYRGKVVYVNFFASWCPPCNMEAPSLAALARRYASRGLVVIGIDEAEPAAKALAFRERYHLPYPIALDPEAKAGAPFGAESLPTQVFFDRNGTAVHAQAGMIDPSSIGQLIDGLLAAGSAH